jgi:4-amino-4-deoxy-L-arabinose transferase-like glycosyltransferase
VLVWTCFQIIVFSAIGIHDDLTEVFVWSRHPAAGYHKHPPLAGLIATAWFAVFPVAEWSFYLLAMVNSAVALFAVDRIARRYVAGDKRLLVLFLLLLTPFYQFHGELFNANAILLPAWPIATYCFLRAFDTRTLAWSGLAGVTAALAMLGKYYSIYLVAGFVIAALCHPRRREFVNSAAPWVSIGFGLAVLAPHFYWLATAGPTPVRYALAVHASHSLWEEFGATFRYAAGGLAYMLIPIAAYLATARPDRRVLAATLWPHDPDRRMLVLLLTVPLLLPLLTAPLLGIKLSSLWTMSGWFLLPIVLLAPAEITPSRAAVMRVPIGVALITVAVLVAAPFVAWQNYLREARHGQVYHRAVSAELTQAWRTAMRRPLTIVSGDLVLTHAISFYSPDHPDAAVDDSLPSVPWITDDRRARQGWAAVCFAKDPGCIDRIERNAAGAAGVIRVEKELTVSFLGRWKNTEQFVFLLIPPQR